MPIFSSKHTLAPSTRIAAVGLLAVAAGGSGAVCARRGPSWRSSLRSSQIASCVVVAREWLCLRPSSRSVALLPRVSVRSGWLLVLNWFCVAMHLKKKRLVPICPLVCVPE
ncbi:hypothetical protein AAHE18_19G097400 [Arachis hypogaea]